MLSDQLHDMVDLREEIAESATLRAREIAVARFGEALDQTDSLEDALTLLAGWVAQELDPLTTDAVRRGARLHMKRKRPARG